jgi:hypothetical protein
MAHFSATGFTRDCLDLGQFLSDGRSHGLWPERHLTLDPSKAAHDRVAVVAELQRHLHIDAGASDPKRRE